MRRGDGGHQILGEREVGLRSKTGLGVLMRQGTYHIICSSFSVFIYSGYALSSVEGRVVMEFFDLSEASQAKM